jgi:Uma2 family endonuclease
MVAKGPWDFNGEARFRGGATIAGEVRVMSAASLSAGERLITGEELARMGDVGRCELVDGRIVPMSPTGCQHGEIEARIAAALSTFVRPKKLGRVLTGEVGLYTRRDPDRVRGADVLFISDATYARRTPGLAYLDVAPEIVVEVLSPEDRAVDVNQKLREYFAIGVAQVWVADPQARAVTVYRTPTDAREFAGAERLTGGDELPGFEMAVASLFDE